ncbi:MAG: ABC transporter permease [Gammaproteobacteria bacterium]|nr:ABC transporter permease [Gammaproteobacteria bacterium]MBU2185377.1 ABC transporter permease [Gammaproteobacteria bacterium]MBU2207071.1 ABC transporter permease [Gammaproteobacteria bacterium]
MRTADFIKLILRSLTAAKMRSSLTALGIAVGICAVTLLTSLGEGVRHYVLSNFSQFGTRIIAINPGKTLTGGMGGMLQTDRPLTLYDAQALARLPHVTHVVPLVQGSGTIEAGGRARSTDIIGANHAIHSAWQFNIALGRGLPEDESGRSRSFAVLGHKLQQELFGGQNPLGQSIRVGGMRFRIVGVMAAKGQMLGFDLDDMVFIPVDKALMLFNRNGLMEIDVVFSDSASTDQLLASIRKQLIARHGAEDFSLISQDDMLQSLDNILQVLTAAVAALGAISLLVGAVGIVTIMSTAVRERTSEIGLLTALGCNQRQVLLLFLGEAVALSLAGGIAGIGVAIALVLGLAAVLPALPLQLSLFYLSLALLLSIAIGLAAGITPARQAAQMNPIDALRAE